MLGSRRGAVLLPASWPRIAICAAPRVVRGGLRIARCDARDVVRSETGVRRQSWSQRILSAAGDGRLAVSSTLRQLPVEPCRARRRLPLRLRLKLVGLLAQVLRAAVRRGARAVAAVVLQTHGTVTRACSRAFASPRSSWRRTASAFSSARPTPATTRRRAARMRRRACRRLATAAAPGCTRSRYSRRRCRATRCGAFRWPTLPRCGRSSASRCARCRRAACTRGTSQTSTTTRRATRGRGSRATSTPKSARGSTCSNLGGTAL